MIGRVWNALAEGGLYTLLGVTLVFGGCFLLFAWWMTRPEGGRTGIHRDGAQEAEGSVPARHRQNGGPGESTRVLRYDSAVARARVMNEVTGESATVQEPAPEISTADAGWFYNALPDQVVLFDNEGRPVRIINGDDYVDRKGAIDKELFQAGLPMIPDLIPYIETRGVRRDNQVPGRHPKWARG
jgi:hypothetical protein